MKKFLLPTLLLLSGSTFVQAASAATALSLDKKNLNTVTLDRHIKDNVRKASASRTENEDWKLLGTGKYTDDIMTVSDLPSETWEVEIYESVATPGFYRVENPYGNGKCPYFESPFDCCDFLLHAEDPEAVWMEYVELKDVDFGLTADNEYCPAYTGDMMGYYICEGWFDAETAIAMGMASGKMVGGNITFEAGSLILDFPLYDGGTTLAANNSGLFCVSLPGASDYSLTVDSGDICTEGVLTFTYKSGADIAQVRYDIFKGLLSFNSYDDDLFEKVKADGTVAADGSATVEPVSGINTVAIAAMAENGDIVGKKILYCFGQHEEADDWVAIGKAEYSEDVLASIYPDEIDHTVYEVDIQQSLSVPGRYRLVDMYGQAFPYYQDLLADGNIMPGHNHHHYTILDATDPEKVYIEASPLGADFGYGQAMLFSEGWFSMQMGADLTDPAVLEGFGKLEDGKVTFLGGAIFMYMPDYGMPRGNINHKFYIKLPDMDSVSDVIVDNTQPVYYNLSGTRISRPATPGVYVKVTGTRAEKIYMK